MKPLLSLLFSLTFALTSFGQNNGVYLYGFMENAPAESISIDVLLVSDSNLTIGTVMYTEPSGNISSQWIDLPQEFEISWVSAGFNDCTGIYNYQVWDWYSFDNLIDIPINLNFCTDSMLYGCTDPESINFNPNATIDDGSCEYASDCELNEITINIQTSSWGYEISWNLFNDTTSVAYDGNYPNHSLTSSIHCVPDGCYILEMYDSYGDGWNGATYEIVLSGNVIASGTLTQGSFGMASFGINQEDCPAVVYGCTDPLAVNYNPTATHNNGTCTYPTINDICADALPILPGITLVDNTNASINSGIWGECWGFGLGEGEQSSVWYSFTTPDFPARIRLEALYDSTYTLTDTQFGIFEECGGEMIYCDGNGGQGLMSALNFECGDLTENTTYILMIDGWNGDAGTCFLEYSVDSTCTDPIYGCMDPNALNYNPNATADNGSCQYPIECDLNQIQVVIHTNLWAYEISWSLIGPDSTNFSGGGNYANNSDNNSVWCLPDGCYTFEMFDSFGDGWNGGSFEVIGNGEILAYGTLSSGNFGFVNFGINQECADAPIYGCTDPNAMNYNPDATISDGSCNYEIECTEVTIVLDGNIDSQAQWILTSDTAYINWGTYPGSDITITECLPDGCYTIQLATGDTMTQTIYTVFANNQIVGYGDFSNYQLGQFSIGSGCDSTNVVYGCTDPDAVNYNPAATEDDGSCVYQFECSIDFLVIPDSTGESIIWILPSDNILAVTSILWDFGDGTTSTELFPQHEYSGDGPFTLCVTASFESPDGSSCTITYCAVISGEMVGGSGFVASDTGFSVNVVNSQTPVGIAEPELFTNLNLWPNPVSDQLNIKYHTSLNSGQTISIMDITGKTIIQENMGAGAGEFTKVIDVSRLPAGVYLLRLSADEYVEAKRFVIAK